LIYYFVALVVIAVDQLTKWLVVQNIPLRESIPVIGEFFLLTSHRNTGAAFGILQNQRWFFIAVTIVVVIGIVIFLQRTVRNGKKLLPFALSLLLGGAIGNFVDRLLFGEVVDFLEFRFQFSMFGKAVDYTYPIFNLADSAIVTGVALIFLETLLSWRKEKKRHNEREAVQ